MLSHCTLFQRCPCLNFNHGNIRAYFSKLMHNMVDYNTNNSITKIFNFFSTYIVRFQNIFVIKKMYIIVF